jgi:hypothetical protein
MAEFESKADLAVRQAVDAYIEGRLARMPMGDLIFETKNSRYRVVKAVLTAAPDSILLGAELVGWLFEGANPSVKPAWHPDCRAVLVDRKRGRHIVVTSRVKMCSQVQQPLSGSGGIQAGSTVQPPAAAHHARRPLSAPPPREATFFPAPAPAVRVIPRPPPIPARRSTDPIIARRTGSYHSMPTRTNEPHAASDLRAAPAGAAARSPSLRPLPFPTLPMRRDTSSGQMSAAPHSRRTLPPLAPPPAHGLTPWSTAARPQQDAHAAPPEAQLLPHPQSDPLAPPPRWTKTVPMLPDAPQPQPRSEPRAALPSAPAMMNAGLVEHHAPPDAPQPSLSLARPTRAPIDAPPSAHPRARQRGVALR